MTDNSRMSRLSSLLRRRGFVMPSFELYGGVSGLIDYGPLGARIKRKVIQSWIDHWSTVPNVVEVDSPTITPESVLVASGHVGEFNDKMSECQSCEGTFRTDHLLEGFHNSPETLDAEEMDRLISEKNIKCPSCGLASWKAARPMNLMFKTRIGAMGGSRTAYMRPETAQGMFMSYPTLNRHFRQRLPFGALQTGKGYRNEISPRQGMIRLREFNMAELEYFIDPNDPPSMNLNRWTQKVMMIPDTEGPNSGEKTVSFQEAFDSGIVGHPTVAWFLAMTFEFLTKVGIESSKIRFRQHEGTEMAHYAADCWDCELNGEHGWVEVVGIANRTCHDLQSHEEHSGSNLLKGWRKYESPISEKREYLSPVGSVVGPTFRERAALVSEALSNLAEIPEIFPFSLALSDGMSVEITEEMVIRTEEDSVLNGEYFTPHVIEPAFGIDRIIWHILDHNYQELSKEGEDYTILSLEQDIAPYDVVILPLFDKDGMDIMADEISDRIAAIPGILWVKDASRSIGRRYARSDEIGIPWAITVDHQSLEDGTVTVRRRDDQAQVRSDVDSILELLSLGTVSTLF
ncbi:MAG: glycine--tRNA ligase [Euryarchaeota archaeon]|nr:glycine--tRNA ligase [Euryarchaeota archaeon]